MYGCGTHGLTGLTTAVRPQRRACPRRHGSYGLHASMPSRPTRGAAVAVGSRGSDSSAKKLENVVVAAEENGVSSAGDPPAPSIALIVDVAGASSVESGCNKLANLRLAHLNRRLSRESW